MTLHRCCLHTHTYYLIYLIYFILFMIYTFYSFFHLVYCAVCVCALCVCVWQRVWLAVLLGTAGEKSPVQHLMILYLFTIAVDYSDLFAWLHLWHQPVFNHHYLLSVFILIINPLKLFLASRFEFWFQTQKQIITKWSLAAVGSIKSISSEQLTLKPRTVVHTVLLQLYSMLSYAKEANQSISQNVVKLFSSFQWCQFEYWCSHLV